MKHAILSGLLCATLQVPLNLLAQEEYRPDVTSRVAKTIDTRLPFSTKNTAVKVEIVNGIAIMDGDIILGPEASITGANVVIRDGSQYRWPGGRIPFEISSSFTEARVNDINAAVAMLNDKTNLLAFPRTTESDYIRFVPSTGCSSHVGRKGGMQEINLADGCGVGSIVHEMFHSAGVFHEQQREDRDNYITINWSNIKDGKGHNFERQTSGATDIGAYDYCSIMHYPRTAFGKLVNGVPQETITCKSACACLGNRSSPSTIDVQSVNSIYPSEFSLPWALMAGSSGRDIAASSDGNVYLTNTAGKIYKLVGNAWQQLSGSDAVSIAANNGKVCMVNTAGKIYSLSGSSWSQMTGSSAVDIAITKTGTIWMVNTAGKIYKYSGSAWVQQAGSDAARIAAGGSEVWMVNTAGLVYRWTGTAWEKKPGSSVRDIAVGNDGTFWVTNTNGSIFKWNGAGWSEIYGSAGSRLSVNTGKAYMVNTSGKIYNLIY